MTDISLTHRSAIPGPKIRTRGTQFVLVPTLGRSEGLGRTLAGGIPEATTSLTNTGFLGFARNDTHLWHGGILSAMSFVQRPSFEWQLRTRSLALGERTLVMAIVNLTPDSFSGDGAVTESAGLAAAVAAVDAGADIVDLGAESTRPNAEPVDATTEQARLLPVLRGLLRERPGTVVSVDTYHAATARAAAEAGAEIVNDVSGLLWDDGMAAAVAETGCGLVLMHTRGRSKDWATQSRLAPNEVLPTVLDGLRERLAAADTAGVRREKIVVDPGFGFGKVGSENLVLLAGLSSLGKLGYPVLAGLSRKGFLGEAARAVQGEGVPIAKARFLPTVAGNTAAALAGAHVLRVHDVQAAREAGAVADGVLRGLR